MQYRNAIIIDRDVVLISRGEILRGNFGMQYLFQCQTHQDAASGKLH